MKNKSLFALLGILVVTAVLSGYLAYRTPRQNTQITSLNESKTPISTPTAQIPTSTPKTSPAVKNEAKIPTRTPAIDEKNTVADKTTKTSTGTPQLLTAKLVAGKRTYNLKFKDGENLITAMQRLQIMSDQPFTMTTKHYAGLGELVEEINGLKNNPTTNEYWILYINKKNSNLGASGYILKPGDNIEWKYEKSTF